MRNTIKKHKDFMSGEDTPKFICDLFIAKARPSRFPNDARFGITATKRTFRHAVDRNRAKRLIRVWIRGNESRMSPELDYVFIARSSILDAKLPDGLESVRKALKKLSQKKTTA
ncbi:MAG: ribonuclease P protein component [Rickettsiales bacterium]|nr:ribonuclease P protein component [Rickettsiales bacterium]